MRPAPTVLTLCLTAGLVTAGPAHALGFGRVASATQLGQRLNFAALLRLDPDESIERSCVSAEVMAGDSQLQPGQVHVTLEGGPDVPDRTVRVTTSTVIEEPVVTITVSVGCSSRATRRFVVFIDPPDIQFAQSAPAADLGLLLPQRTDSQVAPLLAIVAPQAGESRAGAVPPRGSSPIAVRRPTRSAMAHGAADALHSSPRRLASAGHGPGEVAAVAHAHKPEPMRHLAAAGSNVARASAGGRLHLDAPVVRTAALAPAEGASVPRSLAVADLPPAPAASGAAAAASASDPQAEVLAGAEQQRKIQSLEDGMTRLRADAAVTQKTLRALEARLQSAESERQAGPWTIGLAVLSGLLAAILAGLLWRRRSRDPKPAQWWAGAPERADESAAVALHADLPARPAERAAADATLSEGRPDRLPLEDLPFSAVDVSLPGLTVTSASWTSNPAAAEGDEAHAIVVSAAMPLANDEARAGFDRHGPGRHGSSDRELSVEELIDLEQQAEFFVVLGQDDAAIDLLTHHVRGDGGASPLPYLKLLEIHRRRGERGGYEAIGASFNEHFNACAPDWDADLQHGRTLEDYPEVVDRLQRLWATPSRAMETLDAAVFRRTRSDPTFDLPAYRELLFLYTIARDQAEQPAVAEGGSHDPVGQVDLLLPFGAADDQADPIARLSASGNGRPLTTSDDDGYTRPLDLDVSLAAEPLPVRLAATPTSRPKAVAPTPSALPNGHFDSAETVPSALRRPVGYPDESAFVELDLDLEPVGPGGHASVR